MANREHALAYQSDLARDYEDLYRQVNYLDVELMTAHLPHRNQAVMLIDAVGMQPGSLLATNDQWPRQLAELYMRWAERKGYEFDLYPLVAKEDGSVSQGFARLVTGNFQDLLTRFAALKQIPEIAVYMQGTNVFGFLKGERGLHRLAAREASADQLAQVRVYAIPDGTAVSDWLNDYHKIKQEISDGKRPEPQHTPYPVIRVYSLDRTEKFIRDARTGVRLTNTRDVMGKGLLDEFILAYLRTEEANMSWEDRFPPTFPY
jgi:PCRF domain